VHKNKKSQKIRKFSLLDSLPKNEEEFLKRLIAHSEKMISPNNTEIDMFFRGQADRQRAKLENLIKTRAIHKEIRYNGRCSNIWT